MPLLVDLGQRISSWVKRLPGREEGDFALAFSFGVFWCVLYACIFGSICRSGVLLITHGKVVGFFEISQIALFPTSSHMPMISCNNSGKSHDGRLLQMPTSLDPWHHGFALSIYTYSPTSPNRRQKAHRPSQPHPSPHTAAPAPPTVPGPRRVAAQTAGRSALAWHG
jgi:hypothetical protein